MATSTTSPDALSPQLAAASPVSTDRTKGAGACSSGLISSVLSNVPTFLNLVVEPLTHGLHLFFGVRREQVVDRDVGRGYQD